MENKDLFDWIGFIGGVLTILGWLEKVLRDKIKKIEKPHKRRKRRR
ncbi:MAG: hypothetical protein IJ849_12735 [Selenomonadaceae bacterium]|nr:hypothetical protein [Selenomonadaceae bacterium]